GDLLSCWRVGEKAREPPMVKFVNVSWWEGGPYVRGSLAVGLCEIGPIITLPVIHNVECRRFAVDVPLQPGVINVRAVPTAEKWPNRPTVRIYPNHFGAGLRRENQYCYGQTQTNRAHVSLALSFCDFHARVDRTGGFKVCC